eukprot:symbB.v1.2.034861.t1/scaffold4577.1/size37779/2
MFRSVTFLYMVFQVLARRGVEVAPLIQDQSPDDAAVVKPSKVHNDTSFTELSAQLVDSSESPKADPLKTALPKKESKPLELPQCSNGTLHLESRTYKVTQQLKIPEACNISSNGATLLLSAPLLFSKTARFEGKLSVKGLGSLEGPCFWFREDAFIQSSAEMHFADCHNVAKDSYAFGGAICVRGNLTVTGNLSIHNCSATHGGGIYVDKRFANSGGEIQISGSLAKHDGGAINVYHNFEHLGGNIIISNASANQYGGGIFVNQNFEHSRGKIETSASSAKYNGGGIYVTGSFIISGGSLSMSSSSAKYFGGGLFVVGNVVFANATASFSQCHAQREGGGILTSANMSLTNASLMFELATAGDRSAALQASHLEQTGGDMTVYNSSASSEVISVAAWVIDGGTFHIQDCKVDSFLMAAHQGARLNATEFVVSTSSGAGMLLSSGEVTMSSGIFNQTSPPQIRANVVKVTHLNVTGSEASISWSSEESTVQDMDCDEAFGGYNGSDGIGCTKCDPGSVFVKNITEKTITNRSAVQHCVPCPDGARICNATAIQMLPGMMLQQKNISRAWRCPNSLACEGGKVSSNASTEMCAEGYEDVGCAKCTNDCARSNSNVFICLKCAKGTWWKVKDYFLFFASDAVIFIVSAAGVVSAGRQNKNSTVYLNQLMAFAAAPANFHLHLFPCSGRRCWRKCHNCLDRVHIEISGPGANTGLISSAFFIGLRGAHAMFGTKVWAASGSRGGHQLLPSKVLLSLWSLPDLLQDGTGTIGSGQDTVAHCLAGANPFFGMTIAVLAIILCFAVGPGSWIRMTQDKSLKDEPQVRFLTRSYRKGFETWEVERLVRKMLLKMINVTLPITLNPSTQMGFFSFVLMASFGLHATQAPYTKDQWNKIELGLLVMALLVVNLTTMCLANEIHWAHSEEVQVTLIVVITVIVAIAGGLQSFLLIRELILERRPQPVNTPELMEPIEPTEGGEDVEVSKD